MMTPYRFSFDGVDYVFNVTNPDDAIQKKHVQGELFDYGELLIMGAQVADGDTIVDVGANVGNHAVYFSKRFPRSEIICFEPMSEAISLLQANLDANNCSNVNRTYIGYGLSSSATPSALMIRGGPNNLGNSRIVSNAPNSPQVSQVPLLVGDQALKGKVPKLIKIDVEGHELEVLKGLSNTILDFRPALFVEVRNDQIPAFDAWRELNNYHIEWTDSHYAKVTNFLIKYSH